MSLTTTIEFEPTPEGVANAQSELDRFKAILFGDDARGAEASAQDPQLASVQAPPDEAPSAVHRGTGESTRTRELLHVLPGDIQEAMTPAEIGEVLTPNDDGSPLSPAQVRAVMRNEKRIERTLKKRGVILEDREVVKSDFSRYDAEGCGRYYVSRADYEVIQTL